MIRFGVRNQEQFPEYIYMMVGDFEFSSRGEHIRLPVSMPMGIRIECRCLRMHFPLIESQDMHVGTSI